MSLRNAPYWTSIWASCPRTTPYRTGPPAEKKLATFDWLAAVTWRKTPLSRRNYLTPLQTLWLEEHSLHNGYIVQYLLVYELSTTDVEPRDREWMFSTCLFAKLGAVNTSLSYSQVRHRRVCWWYHIQLEAIYFFDTLNECSHNSSDGSVSVIF